MLCMRQARDQGKTYVRSGVLSRTHMVSTLTCYLLRRQHVTLRRHAPQLDLAAVLHMLHSGCTHLTSCVCCHQTHPQLGTQGQSVQTYAPHPHKSPLLRCPGDVLKQHT